jgi:predicted transcriptional regulator
VAERKDGTVKLSVFKGREAKLNWVIFQILSHESPLTIYEVCKRIKTKTGLKHVKYTNINRRVRALSTSGYLQETETRKTKAGFQSILYEMTTKAYLSIILNEMNLDNFIQKATEEQKIATIAALLTN